jgi:flagellar motor component MotA
MSKFYIITGATIFNNSVKFKKNKFNTRTAAIDAYFRKYEKYDLFNMSNLQVEDEIIKDNKHDIEYVCSPDGNRFRVTRVTY